MTAARLLVGAIIAVALGVVGVALLVDARWPVGGIGGASGSAQLAARWLGVAFVAAAQLPAVALAAWAIYPHRRGDRRFLVGAGATATVSAFAAAVLWSVGW